MSHHSSFLCSDQCFHLTTGDFPVLGPLLWTLQFSFQLQTQTEFQQKLHQSQLEVEDSLTGVRGVRRMNFLLSSSSPLWVVPITCSQLCLWCPYDLVTILPISCLNFLIICKEKFLYLFHLLFNSKFVGEGHKQSKWKISTCASQFRAQQEKKKKKKKEQNVL